MIPILKKIVLAATVLLGTNIAYSQYCTPTYTLDCWSGGGFTTFDVIDNFWTEGGETNISNLDTDCCLLPNSYWSTGLVVTGCPGDEITTNVQCQVGSFVQGFAIWIDWNENFIFEPGEKVYSSPDASDAVYTGTFTIPGTALAGETYNMRVRSRFAVGGAMIEPCANYTYGETEDYIVAIGSCEPTICEGDTATLDLGDIAPGAIGYSWTPTTDIADPSAGPVIEAWPTDSTEYTCTVSYPDGSTLVVPIMVSVNPPALPVAVMDDSLCHDPAVGYPLDVAINPDVDPETVSFSWEMDDFDGVGAPFTLFTPSETVADPGAQVSIPGTYHYVVTVTDLNGVCDEATDTVLITYSEEEHTTTKTDPLCFGSSDGTITVTSTGTLGAVEYSIDGGATWQISNVFLGLPSGTYTVTSRDVIGCDFSSDIELLDPEEMTITVSSDTTICQNGTATLIATATGGTTYTYDWSVPEFGDEGTQLYSPVIAFSTVTVTGYNEFGCSSPMEEIEVTLLDPLTLAISVNDSVCPGYDSGAGVVALGGDGAYTYAWTSNGTALFDITNSIATNPTEETTYCVTVSDGCETTPVEICTKTIMRPVPMPAFTSDATKGCDPTTFNFTTSVAPTDSSTWTMDGRTFAGVNDIYVEFSGVDFYDVSLEVYNQYGCHASITIPNYIEIVDVPDPELFINPNPTTIFNTEVTLNGVSREPDDTYSWNLPGGTPETSTEEDPSVTYPDGIAGDYLVELTVTNAFGCATTISDYVHILSDVLIYAPNAFTPDGDQYNEGWKIYMDGIDVYDYHCMVFNKWGEMVWESYNADATWDGTYGAQLAPEGTYVWVVNAKERTNDRKVEFRGYVNLFR